MMALKPRAGSTSGSPLASARRMPARLESLQISPGPGWKQLVRCRAQANYSAYPAISAAVEAVIHQVIMVLEEPSAAASDYKPFRIVIAHRLLFRAGLG